MDKLVNDFSFGLFFWQALILVVLLVLLAKYAWKPIMTSITEREEGILNAIASAENAKKEMQNLKADNEKLLAAARAERDLMLKEAREMREKMIADSKTDAQAEGARMIEQAKIAIQSEKNAAMSELKAQVSTLSLEIAEKLLKTELASKDSQKQLVEKMLGEVTLN